MYQSVQTLSLGICVFSMEAGLTRRIGHAVKKNLQTTAQTPSKAATTLTVLSIKTRL